jgi:hypothetical protein
VIGLQKWCLRFGKAVRTIVFCYTLRRLATSAIIATPPSVQTARIGDRLDRVRERTSGVRPDRPPRACSCGESGPFANKATLRTVGRANRLPYWRMVAATETQPPVNSSAVVFRSRQASACGPCRWRDRHHERIHRRLANDLIHHTRQARGGLWWWARPASLAEGLIHYWSPTKNDPKSVPAPALTPLRRDEILRVVFWVTVHGAEGGAQQSGGFPLPQPLPTMLPI